HGGDHGIAEAAEGAEHRKSKLGEDVLHHHRHQNFILDKENPVAALEAQWQTGPVLTEDTMHACLTRDCIDDLGMRDRQRAMQSFRAPMKTDLTLELALDAGADHANAESWGLRRGHRGAAPPGPPEPQVSRPAPPSDRQPALYNRQG